MSSVLLFTSFIAGILTILAPCVLPLLPVIVGSTAGSKNKWKPIIVTSSLGLSIVAFTLLLKASTLFIDIPQYVWASVSGGIVLLFGLTLAFPKTWEKVATKLKISKGAQGALAKSGTGDSVWSSVLIGASLGPVFSSCSPTYFIILATVLPVNFFEGLVYLFVYAFGLVFILSAIAIFGQKITAKLTWAADPYGWFKKSMGVLLILVGLAVVTGIDKKIEEAVLDAGFGVTDIEENLLNNTMEEMEMEEIKEINDSSLPFLNEAPELIGLENWINSDPIFSMEELKGKVVLIDFWTYSCINCIRTLPYLQDWHDKYADDGLVVLGVHAPEFQFEQKVENVQKAVNDFEITYPVVQDNNFELWRAYNNRYWPAKYLIDKNGTIRYTHFGEGEYAETEEAIVELLNAQVEQSEVVADSAEFKKIGTPETYIGSARRKNFVESGENLKLNQWTLSGDWNTDKEKATSISQNAAIKMKFKAAKANLVIGGVGTVEVFIDGKKATAQNSGKDLQNGILEIDGERLYELANFNGEYEEHEIEIKFLDTNISIFAWTFG